MSSLGDVLLELTRAGQCDRKQPHRVQHQIHLPNRLFHTHTLCCLSHEPRLVENLVLNNYCDHSYCGAISSFEELKIQQKTLREGDNDMVEKTDTEQGIHKYAVLITALTFAGNMNADSVVHHKLLHSVRARFVRFVPLEWNPTGKIGMRVEVYGCSYKSDVADFDGRSSLLYRFNQKLMSTLKDVISLKFKSMQGDGVLFHGEGQRGDHITLELQKGRLALHLNLDDSKPRLSSSPPAATLGSLLDDQHWHSVLLERVGKQVNFTVDKHTQHFRTKGEADALDIDYELSFGGIPVPGKPGTFLKKNFHGCIENLYYNGVNIIDLAKRRKHQIYTVGNVTFSCAEPQIVPVTFLSSTSSYLLLPGTPQIDGLSVSFQFRTWNHDGLLLSTELSEGSGTLLLSLEGGTLRLVIQKVTERAAEILTGSNLNDGLWHSVSIIARRNRITLTLDNDATSPAQDTTRMQIYSGNHYYFGGCPDNLTDSQCLNPIKAFQGCMRLIFIDNQPKDLIPVQQGSLGNFSDLHIDLCSIKDRFAEEWGEDLLILQYPPSKVDVGKRGVCTVGAWLCSDPSSTSGITGVCDHDCSVPYLGILSTVIDNPLPAVH
ncbi:hypothetical protein CB1_001533062 [Camelus ferus]|nr:hypothetical protein CB1_001533062 [Camelus ferus]